MKNTQFKVILTLVATILIFSVCTAQARVIISDTSSETAQDTPITSDVSNNGNQDVTGGVLSSPSTNPNQDGLAGVISDHSTDINQDLPVSDNKQGDQDNNNPADSPSGGIYSSSGGRIWPVSVVTVGTTSPVQAASCELVTTYLKQGWNNPAAEITKLQMFLKNVEKLNVAITGTFDDETKAGVEAFQRKYLNDVLGPWDATLPSGMVYITTLKKINQISCGTPITLDAQELATIVRHIQERDSDFSTTSDEVGVASDGVTINATGSIPIGPIIGEDGDLDQSGIATVGRASILRRFWEFLKSIF